MIWDALILDDWLDVPDIAGALADAFGIDAQTVLVADELPPDADVSGVKVMVERTPCRGDFRQKLDIYVRDAGLGDRVQFKSERTTIVRRICALLHCSCLLGGNDAMGEPDWVVGPAGGIHEVVLDETLPADELVVRLSRPVDVAA